MLAELGHELWIGDSAKIRASEVRKQKTDKRDALLILDLLLAKRFPRIWVPSPAERDLRQLLWHRHKLVRLRTMLGNQLHALALTEGLRRKKKLFTKKGRAELAGGRPFSASNRPPLDFLGVPHSRGFAAEGPQARVRGNTSDSTAPAPSSLCSLPHPTLQHLQFRRVAAPSSAVKHRL
ncbi:MAG: transposase [Candidatus Acidiferrales bacterium]